jgi:hypothetical protein
LTWLSLMTALDPEFDDVLEDAAKAVAASKEGKQLRALLSEITNPDLSVELRVFYWRSVLAIIFPELSEAGASTRPYLIGSNGKLLG